MTATDTPRLARIQAILDEAAARLQVLILTCHPERYGGLEAARFIDLREVAGSRSPRPEMARLLLRTPRSVSRPTAPPGRTRVDPPGAMCQHAEQRYLTIGMSERRVLLVVAHMEGRDEIRIISARKATSRERRFYEEGCS